MLIRSESYSPPKALKRLLFPNNHSRISMKRRAVMSSARRNLPICVGLMTSFQGKQVCVAEFVRTSRNFLDRIADDLTATCSY